MNNLDLSEDQAILDSINKKDIPTLKNLIEAGFNLDINIKSSGYTPLYLASSEGYSYIVQLLLSAGVDPNKIYHKGKQTPLSRAVEQGHTDIVKLLLKFKANPNLKDSLQQTALFYAVGLKRINIVKILLNSGANVNYQNIDGNTCLMMAVSLPNRDWEAVNSKIAQLLINYGADYKSLKNNAGANAFFMALMNQTYIPERK